MTPHGLARMVTRHGTARINLVRERDGDIIGEFYDGPRIELHLREPATGAQPGPVQQ
ncbi:hypothetical protein [Nocardioides silvaticus]|uniref:hypothetical protein n=1 Tax=Nocardioides silvaticus TaxID=2201891 RepID=UPI0013049E13|nr:hypothetical protein [Nocardioides silvaticus]